MMDITGSASEQNLRNAIVGEHQAFVKFLRIRNIEDVKGPPAVGEHPKIDQLFRDLLVEKVEQSAGQGPSAVAYGDAMYIPGVMDYLWYPFPALECTQADVDKYTQYAGTARAEGFIELADWFTALAAAEASSIRTPPAPGSPPVAQFGTFHFEPN
jgi:hypothetical protein